MLYHLHDLHYAMLTPARLGAEMTKSIYQSGLNPLAYTRPGRTIAAYAEMFERMSRRFNEPEFGIHSTTIDGREVRVETEYVVEKPFCGLLHFRRHIARDDPKVLIVAPLAGHFATLLRGSVAGLLPHHDVYITDWNDARMVPLSDGFFDLDDCITYIREFLSLLGPDTHVIAVCQPSVPVLATVALMADEGDPNQPKSMTLMGGPIDTRVSKTSVTQFAESRPLSWFKNNVIYHVPFYYPGAFRRVYPGFIQLSGFMQMNLDTHVGKHMQFFEHLVKGDGESAEAHRRFYNEFLAVMDLTEEFYLQSVATVFQRHDLPKGEMVWRDPCSDEELPVRPNRIGKTALLTIEGELDDISATGQTTAAHDLCTDLPANRQFHHFQENVGHYGIFNGRRWRNAIMPRIRHFIRRFDSDKQPVPRRDLAQTGDLQPEQFDKDRHGAEAASQFIQDKNKA